MNRTKLGKFTYIFGFVFLISYSLYVLENVFSCLMQGVFSASFFGMLGERPEYLFEFFFGSILMVLFLVPVTMMGLSYKKNEPGRKKALAVWLMVLSFARALNDALRYYFWQQHISKAFLDQTTVVCSICGILAFVIFGLAMLVYLVQPDDYERFMVLIVIASAAVNCVYTYGVFREIYMSMQSMFTQVPAPFYAILFQEYLAPLSTLAAMVLFPLWLAIPDRFYEIKDERMARIKSYRV